MYWTHCCRFISLLAGAIDFLAPSPCIGRRLAHLVEASSALNMINPSIFLNGIQFGRPEARVRPNCSLTMGPPIVRDRLSLSDLQRFRSN